MKLQELVEAADEKKEKEDIKGTYAGVTFDAKTVQYIKKYAKENAIPNRIASKKIHSTVLYSRKHLPNYTPAGKIDPPYVGKFKEFNIWESQPDEKDGKVNHCLVMQYDCKELSNRHEELMKKHDAQFDYDEFNPHITLSYDVGEDFTIKDLPEFTSNITIVNEYHEPLTLDWSDK